ncbi:drug resistance transporter, EmrB/QacA subfamily [Parafrankia irregularis]|uniref:Drug resistance transporter, EmrB/QacA subfamily n=1 Tax=Parafrankia irregularis TaxID=795642 RepID=A0A0S4QDP8_9ACTN|nr:MULTISPECIES: MFS transporter [Parafrankia]MBE3199709.1 MFS transporter [Parafrankia sp. CH37]CUU53621.1 drug resistance transporter, EmrB/QacA subfamily [Parafrankia irregularis]
MTGTGSRTTAPAAPPNPAPPEGLSGRTLQWLLVVVLLVQAMVALDTSVVNVALPDIQSALDFSPGGLTWVVNAYSLAFGGLIMLGGRTGDLVGRRRALLAGLVVFGVASLAGGLARTPGELIAARAAQGVGAAVLAPIAFTLITVYVPAGPARARALGLWGAAAAVGGAVGVLAGGALTQWAGWRVVLFLNLPVVGFLLAAARRGIPTDRREVPADPREAAPRPRPDVAGALLVTAGTSALVLGVIRTDGHSWGSATTLLTIAAAVVLLAAFVLVETRAAAPLLRMRLLTHRLVVVANLFVLLLFSGQFAAFYFVSLYLQQVLNYSAVATGVAFLPFCAGMLLGSTTASRLAARVEGRLLLAVGGALAAVGFGWFAAALGADGSFLTSILGPSIVTSVGIGLCVVPMGSAATVGVAPAEAGMAAGLITSSRQIGGSIGLAALATVATGVTGRRDGGGPAALAAGYATAVGISGVLLGLAAVLAFFALPVSSAGSRTPVTSQQDV